MMVNKLIETFKKQASFTKAYSPLYTTLFASIASWLENNPDCEARRWLVDVSSTRSPLETSLLLMAGMHREVLLDAPGTQELRQYYPSVGGSKSHNDIGLPKIFAEALTSRKESLSEMMQNATVQTNETARGIFWLFPAVVTGWGSMHLIDLGASAGLNLVGEQRRFAMVGPDFSEFASFGLAPSTQFVTKCEPVIPHSWNALSDIPCILTRSGCDLNPLPLETDIDQKILKSFVWADQLERMARLEEGIMAHASVSTKQQIQVMPANLPHDLPYFLRSLSLDDDKAPVLIYNTYMTAYLENEGLALYDYIADWAAETNRPVLWAQAEPPKEGMVEAPDNFHWCAWTIDLWQPGKGHSSWHIAWVHPHGTEVKWLNPSLELFLQEFSQL